MAGGRPPKPTALKVLHGNPGKRRLNQNEPTYPATRLGCPRWMTGEARREWRRIVPMLRAQRVITEADRVALECRCLDYQMFRGVVADIAEHGTTDRIPIQNAKGEVVGEREIERPQYKQMLELQDRLLRWDAKLGLTPSDRAKVSRQGEEQGDPFADFLKKNKPVQEASVG